MTTPSARPDYGIDAPGAVRNLFLVSAIAGLIWAATMTHVWSGILQFKIGGIDLRV